MASQLRKPGLWLAATALAFVVLVLPLHTHTRTTPDNNSDCAVCHFVQAASTLTALHTVSIAPPLFTHVGVVEHTVHIAPCHDWIAASPRAPPTA